MGPEHWYDLKRKQVILICIQGWEPLSYRLDKTVALSPGFIREFIKSRCSGCTLDLTYQDLGLGLRYLYFSKLPGGAQDAAKADNHWEERLPLRSSQFKAWFQGCGLMGKGLAHRLHGDTHIPTGGCYTQQTTSGNAVECHACDMLRRNSSHYYYGHMNI